jgi:hypothetical protein
VWFRWAARHLWNWPKAPDSQHICALQAPLDSYTSMMF